MRTPHATRAGRLSLKLKLERLLCRALAPRVCRDLLRLLAWPVMDFQLRADRVCRDASQMRPKCRLLPQFSFSFCFGLRFRCVALRVAPLAAMHLQLVGHNLLTISASLGPVPVPRCLAWHASSTCSQSKLHLLQVPLLSLLLLYCCCPFKGRTLSAAFRGATMPVVLGCCCCCCRCCPCLGQLHINHAVLSIC